MLAGAPADAPGYPLLNSRAEPGALQGARLDCTPGYAFLCLSRRVGGIAGRFGTLKRLPKKEKNHG